MPDETDPGVPVAEYRLAGPSAAGRGRVDDNGFVVYADARARATEVPSLKDRTRRVRHGLLRDGVIAREGGGLVLTSDQRFSTPSQAVAVFLGGPANGWTEWKDAEVAR